jgi:hypothetical protein
MIISNTALIFALKALVAGSTFFVWVVRYQNIIEEFKEFGLPIWLRDLVGILKLSFVIMLFSTDLTVVILGSAGIAGLMVAALITHLRIKNPFLKMLPSMCLILISCIIIVFSFQGL